MLAPLRRNGDECMRIIKVFRKKKEAPPPREKTKEELAEEKQENDKEALERIKTLMELNFLTNYLMDYKENRGSYT
jgi:hypothetical protein